MNTRSINKVLDGKFRKGGFARSSVVKGWGTLIRGYEITPDVKDTYSDHKIRGKWVTWHKQTGVYAITWTLGERPENYNDNVPEILKAIAKELKDAGMEVTLDLKGKYTIYGEGHHEHGAKVIVGDVKILDEKHF